MRALRSRTVGNSSDSSINTSQSKINKKKTRSRKTKLSISKSSNGTSDTENILNKTEISTKYNDEVIKSSRKSVRKNTDSEINISSLEAKPNRKTRRTKKRHSSLKNQLEVSNSEVNIKNATFDSQSDGTISKSSPILNKSDKFSKIVNSCKNTSSLFDISTGQMLEELTKLEFNSTDERNKTLTQEQSCIIINDSIDCSTQKNGTFNKIDTFDRKNGTFNLNSSCKNETFDKNNVTFEKINTSFEKLDNELIESRNRRSSRRDTYQIKNSSGKWSVDDVSLINTLDRSTLHKEKKLSNPTISEEPRDKPVSSEEYEILNELTDRVTLHKKKETTFLLEKNDLNNTLDTPSKLRKKWVKFNSAKATQSPILRKSGTFTTNKSDSLCSSTPFPKTYPVTPARLLNKSKTSTTNKLIEISSNSKSIRKSNRKPGTIPNFAKIHQKANEKIESIKEYSERKKQRAEMLLSGKKPDIPKTNAVKSSNELFGNTIPNENPPQISSKNKKSKTPEKHLSLLVAKQFVSKLPQWRAKAVKTTTVTKENAGKKVEKTEKTLKVKAVLKESNTKLVSKGAITINPVIKTNSTLDATLNSVKKLDKVDSSLDKSEINLKFNSSLKSKAIITKPTLSKGHFQFGKGNNAVAKVEDKPVSVFSKGHYQAVANKMKTGEKLANRDNRRDQMKGVRTNRRFELLMQMRKNI